MTDNLLRDRLRKQGELVVTFSILPCGEVVEMIGIAGFDGVILDMEHGALSIDRLPGLIRAAEAVGCIPLVRVADNAPALIGAALDAGAHALIVPQINSLEDAVAAVAAARFAPQGHRGANPWVRAAGFSAGADWFERANSAVTLLVMIEGARAVASAAEVLDIPGLDGVFLGPVDLSHSLGLPGQIDHPDVVAKIGEVVALARERGKVTAVFAPTPMGGRKWLSQGADIAAVGVDSAHVLQAFREVAATARRRGGGIRQ